MDHALSSADMLLLGAFRFDQHSRALFHLDSGAHIPIGSRALGVLGVLVQRAGDLVPKDEIMKAVWPETVVEDANLTVHISTLRRILDSGRLEGSCIQTISGRGYRFVGPVIQTDTNGDPGGETPYTLSSAETVAALPKTEVRTAFTATRRPYVRRYIAALLSVAFMIFTGGVWWLWSSQSMPSPTATAPPVATAPLRAPRLSVVVLPFANLSNDPEHEYFVDAITDDLTSDLSRIADSFVIARTTASTYKGKPIDVRQVSRDLGVRYVLEGSVRRQGDRVLVNMQLLDGESGTHIWADRFDTDRRNLAAAQSEITTRVARMLHVELVRDASHRIEQEHAANPDARDLVMRARALLTQGLSPAVHREALDLLERAFALDPASVDGRILMASVLVSGIIDGFSGSAKEDLARAEQLIGEALERDRYRSWTHAVMGMLRRAQGRWPEAKVEFETAIALDPNNAMATRQLGQTVLIQGNPEAAIPYIEKAIRLDPRSPGLFVAYVNLARSHLYLGRPDEAVDLYKKARALNPSIWYVRLGLAGVLGLRGDIDEAKNEIIEAAKLKPAVDSIARYRAISVTQGFDHPRYQELAERTTYTGLRRAGFPEE